jgi:uncharacterized protein YndB with AHSA1/START domain
MASETDRIEKAILLRAPRHRVWLALTDSQAFGSWFGMRLEGPFVPGKSVRGVVVPTTVDPAVARLQKDFEGLPIELTVERIEPEHLFSFRWHPHAIERGVDFSFEPTTLVAFELVEVGDGIRLTVTESGFDTIPLARRAKAFTANAEGWGLVVKLIERYLEAP